MGSAEAESQPKYRFGEFTLNTGRGTLLNADQEVKLRPKGRRKNKFTDWVR